jgi:hypothetical protein
MQHNKKNIYQAFEADASKLASQHFYRFASL